MTKQEIYKLYSDTLLFEGRRISLREIAERFGVSRQMADKQIKKMERQGYLIKIKHRKNQPIYLPKDLIEIYGKSN